MPLDRLLLAVGLLIDLYFMFLCGYYCCVGCDTHSSRFQDLTNAFRASHLTLRDRQEFLMKEDAWKHTPFDPLDKLKIDELRKELQARGIPTLNKKKPELLQNLQNIQRGVANFPALTNNTPLNDLGLDNYEVFPTEPLHDLKGHFSHLITEALKKAPTQTQSLIKKVTDTILNKTTLRASVFRKAATLIYSHLNENPEADKQYVELFRTAAEISELFYSHDYQRSDASILRLYNVTYIHAKLCKELFGDTQNSAFFGRYFHSIVTHSPLVYRLISLRSVNTEMQERVFGQFKQITKSTSNQKPNGVLTNILIRWQEEAKAHCVTLSAPESEISKLAQALPSKTNTVIPSSWLEHSDYQAHLERISDYLYPGPNMWWKQTQRGIEFCDIDSGQTNHLGLQYQHKMHFRSSTLTTVYEQQYQAWEQCINDGTNLPAKNIRCYKSDGTFLRTIDYPLPDDEDTTSHSLSHPTPETTTTLTLGSHSNPETTATLTLGSHPTPETTATLTLGSHPTPETTATLTLGSHPTPETTATLTLGSHPTPETTATLTLGSHPTPETTTTLTLGSHPTPETTTTLTLGSHSTPETTTTLTLGSHPTTSTHKCITSGTLTEEQSAESQAKTMKTTFGRTLVTVMPVTNTLLKFDRLRHKHKQLKTSHRPVPSSLKKDLQELSHELKQQLQLEHELILRDAHKSSTQRHKLNIIRKVLHNEWNIQMHS